MDSLKNLKQLIDVNNITAITTDEASLSIEETLKMMEDVKVEDLNEDLVFWTKDEKVVIDEYSDEWGSEVDLVHINLKPAKGLIKGTPESVVEVWEDPETGKRLPFKTEAYHEKQRKVKQAGIKRIEKSVENSEKHLNSLPVTDVEPFTIIKDGDNNNCRYITLPKEFPLSKSTYGLIGELYENNMNEDLRRVIDFAGYAGIKNGELRVLSRYAKPARRDDDSEAREDALDKYVEVHESAEEDGRIVRVAGFAIESLMYLESGTLDEVAEKIKSELKELTAKV